MLLPRIVSRPCAAIILVVAVLSGCGDSTGPNTGLTVGLALTSLDGPFVNTDNQGGVQVLCDLHLTASTTETGSASWMDGKLRFYEGKDRKTPVDSLILSPGDVATSWGDHTIGDGRQQQSEWSVWSVFPFAGEIEFRYSVGSRVKSVKAPFECRPPVTADTPPPSIGPIVITPSSGELQAGNPLQVSLSMNAPAGLWKTLVHVSGPCLIDKQIDETLQTSATHQIAIPLAGGCRLAVPISVTVHVEDAVAQVASSLQPSTVVLADHEAPTLTALFYSRLYPGSQLRAPSGDYFTGDSIQVLPNARDNYRLSTINWEVLPYGARDSVAVSGNTSSTSLYVQVRPEWSGPIQLRMWARDAVGLTSDTTVTPLDSLRVYPLAVHAIRTTNIPGNTPNFVVDSRRGMVYLLQPETGRIYAFSVATMQVTWQLSLGAFPADFDLTPSGDSLVVLLMGHAGLGVIDLRQPTPALTEMPIAELDPATGHVPAQVRVGSNGKAYITLSGALLELDLATGARRIRSDAGAGGSIGGGSLERSLDHSVMVLSIDNPNCLQRFDLSTNVFGACVQAPRRYGGLSLDAAGQRVAFSVDVYDASLRLFPQTGPDFNAGGSPYTALSADGQSLYVAISAYGYVRRRASDGQILDRTPNSFAPTLFRISADGAMLVSVASGYGTTAISVIDLR